MWRTRISLLGLISFVAVLCLLAANFQGAQASPLAQIPATDTPQPPTNTPQPPTNTPQAPTNTPQPPTNTPVGPTIAPSDTPIGPTPTPRATKVPGGGGGGGMAPGPAATPMVNGCAQSVGKDGISLSTQPGFYQPHVQIVPRGQVVQVVGGPERADTIWWWLVRTTEGVQGWGNQDEMLAVAGPCGASSGGSTGDAGNAPWPVTILPPGEVPQPDQAGNVVVVTPVGAPAVPQQAAPAQAAPAQPAAQATPASQQTLPQTGSGLDWWFLALLLLAVIVVVGVMRRRLQMQPQSGRSTSDDEANRER